MIHYIKGNALEPRGEGKKIIVHCCNDVGAWGKGFVMALSSKWKKPETEYKAMSVSKRKLGNVQLVLVENDITVANIIGQRDIKTNEFGVPPVRYEAIEVGLKRVANWAITTNATLHMPRIACGLAGGRWSIMQKIIEDAVNDVDVYVYDFEEVDNVNYINANLD